MSHDWTPPPPPPPPENRVICSSCGYCAPKTQFNEAHGKQCKHGIFIISTIVVAFALMIVTVVITIVGT